MRQAPWQREGVDISYPVLTQTRPLTKLLNKVLHFLKQEVLPLTLNLCALRKSQDPFVHDSPQVRRRLAWGSVCNGVLFSTPISMRQAVGSTVDLEGCVR